MPVPAEQGDVREGDVSAEPDAPDGPGLAAAEPDRVVELEGQLRRALADLDNLRKRFDREVARERAAARARAAEAWLPIIDDLDRAVEHAGAGDDALMEGVRAVRDQAVAVLTGFGFPRFDGIGEPFDPARHEAMGTVEADAPAGTVVAVVRPGYGSDDSILRPAGVLVARPAG